MSKMKKSARTLPFGLLDGRRAARLAKGGARDRRRPVVLREARRVAKVLEPLLGEGRVSAGEYVQGIYEFPTVYALAFPAATLLLGRYQMDSDSGGVVSNKRGRVYWGGWVPENRDPSIVVSGGPGRYWRFAREHTPEDEELLRAVRVQMTEAGFEDASYFDGGLERSLLDFLETPAGQAWCRRQAEKKSESHEETP